MTDKELADRVVALGVGSHLGNPVEMSRPGYTELGRFYYLPIEVDPAEEGMTADQFESDWRVAGSLMEMCFELNTTRTHAFNPYWPVQSAMSEHQFGGESLPRAIINAIIDSKVLED